ncbi:MAG: hypothetical protein HC786_09365 [Richelia sp. CSU_2_1]|nr:hypothetical protein [Richelia sp. CSU_2_1]
MSIVISQKEEGRGNNSNGLDDRECHQPSGAIALAAISQQLQIIIYILTLFPHF